MSKKVATNKPKELFEWKGDPEDRNMDCNVQSENGLKIVTGADSGEVGMWVIGHAAMTSCAVHEKDEAKRLNMAAKFLQEIGPQDGLEGMLEAQMVQASDMAAECMRRAALPGQCIEAKDKNINQAVKLMRVFREGLEALDKHRGKGQQKITVEHVTVNEGGQAIVGNVHHGGGGKDEKQG